MQAHAKSPASQSWLRATGQKWKFTVFQLLLVVSGLLFVGLVLDVNGIPVLPAATTVVCGLGQVVFGMLSFVWLVGAIRCPACRSSFAWPFISRGEHSSWYLRIVSATECPSCGPTSKDAG